MADGTGESGAKASLATKDAVAPSVPLRTALLLMDILSSMFIYIY